jgi:hypothetical protein
MERANRGALHPFLFQYAEDSMKNRPWPAMLLLLAALLGACASSGGSPTLYQRDVGNASVADAMRLTTLIISRFHYEVYQTTEEPFLQVETHWRPRAPFGDEQALGVTSAENRLLVIARSRGETEFASTYNLRLVVENRVRVAGGVDWNESLNTRAFRAYADSISNDFRREITNIGVRRF